MEAIKKETPNQAVNNQPSLNPSENYLDWHYVQVPKKIVNSTINLTIFLYYFFSISFLIKTLFAPWKRQIVVKKSPGFSLKEFFEVLTFNFISRLVGLMVRLTLIFIWLLVVIITFPLGALVLLIWLILPGLSFPLYLSFGKKKGRGQKLKTQAPLDPQKILADLTAAPLGQFVFSRLAIPVEEIKKIIITEPDKEKFRSGFDKFLDQNKISFQQAEAQHFLKAILKEVVPFKQFLENKGLRPAEFLAVCDWYLDRLRLLEKQTAFWDLENLMKIPPLGKGLVYGYTPNLNRYCADLSPPQSFSHHLIGRQRETTQIEQILSRSAGNNVLLIGEPGVGRHTIAMEFAKRTKEGRVNPALAHKRVLEFGLRRLLSETKSVIAAKGLVEEILTEAAYAGNIILVVEDFDQYVSTGPGRIDLTSVFNKAVAAGVQIVGIAGFADFAKYLYPNQELLKHFEKVEASPPTNAQALTILMDTVDLYEKRSGVFVTYQALREIIDKVDKYITHIPFPEKAIDLLDEACVYAAQKGIKIITPQEVNQVISEKTKIPLGEIKEAEIEKLKNLEKVIHQRIVNQEEAVIAIAKAMRRARVGIAKSSKPIGTFLFMGPTGVGKTETAKALAEGYFGDENRMIRFDMSEYQGADSIERVIGSTATAEPGLITKAIRENPFSILLLDEIEKTHDKILNLFLTMLDEGYFTDAFGKKVDCRNLIIIGTSNAGTELIRQKIKEGIKEEELEKAVIDHVQREGIFSPEFINRFDAVVIYRPLTPGHLTQIAELMLKNLNQRLKKKEISVKITPELLEKIVKLGYDPAFGARPMNRVIQDQVEDQIAQQLLRGEIKKGQEVEIKI
jgi:ATP-dependent Clp protease ATP-binding subunit ClpC